MCLGEGLLENVSGEGLRPCLEGGCFEQHQKGPLEGISGVPSALPWSEKLLENGTLSYLLEHCMTLTLNRAHSGR